MTKTIQPVLMFRFDFYLEAITKAYPILADRGLVGNFAVAPLTIDGGTDCPTSHQLRILQEANWELCGYTNHNVVTEYWDGGSSAGIAAVTSFLAGMKSTFVSKGFDVRTIVPNQRAWNSSIQAISESAGFNMTLNAGNTAALSQPIEGDALMFVDNGGTDSLNSTSTATALISHLDSVQAAGGAWPLVVHRVTEDADVSAYPSYSIGRTEFTAFVDHVKGEVDAGRLRVCIARELAPETWMGT